MQEASTDCIDLRSLCTLASQALEMFKHPLARIYTFYGTKKDDDDLAIYGDDQ